jgi:simple sugar transport system ATP-binding protein
MRAGRTVAATDPKTVTAQDLTRLIIGKTIATQTQSARAVGQPRLRIADLSAQRPDGAPTLNGASLEVRGGQIYGVAGVGGNGQTELAEVVMGVRAASSGSVVMDEFEIGRLHSRKRRERGLASIPADRFLYGLAGDLSISDNFAIGRLGSGRYGGPFWVRRRAMQQDTLSAIAAFDVQGARPGMRAALLSGGNAQKLVLAREFSGEPKVVLAHSPTRGLDVRACAAVHDNLRRMRDRNAAILLISEDLDEILALADRVGVINRGRIVAEFAQPADRHAIGEAMVGHA